MLIWGEFNQKCSYPDIINQNFIIFLTPFPTTTYELYPPQAESIFRYKYASSSNYRRVLRSVLPLAGLRRVVAKTPFRGYWPISFGHFEKFI